jgi:hypothetical protein
MTKVAAMHRSFFTIVLLTIATGPSGAQELGRTCLRFDRPYFVWSFRDSAGNYRADSSSVIALDTSPVRGPIGSRRLDPLPRDGRDTWSSSLWRSRYWRAGGADSVEILWTTMLVGSEFRLVGGDTLKGTVREFSDVVAVDKAGRQLPTPAARRVRAIKTTCPGHRSP